MSRKEFEKWLDVKGYEGMYEVSDHGNVRSLRYVNKMTNKLRDTPLVLKFGIQKGGYRIVQLCKNNKSKTVLVHRLVAEAFVGPCPDGLECGHLDGDCTNNHVTNLKWCTSSENEGHKKIHSMYSNKIKELEAQVALARAALNQALRQWKMYIEEGSRDDIENINHHEADVYRMCFKTLTQLDAKPVAVTIDKELEAVVQAADVVVWANACNNNKKPGRKNPCDLKGAISDLTDVMEKLEMSKYVVVWPESEDSVE